MADLQMLLTCGCAMSQRARNPRPARDCCGGGWGVEVTGRWRTAGRAARSIGRWNGPPRAPPGRRRDGPGGRPPGAPTCPACGEGGRSGPGGAGRWPCCATWRAGPEPWSRPSRGSVRRSRVDRRRGRGGGGAAQAHGYEGRLASWQHGLRRPRFGWSRSGMMRTARGGRLCVQDVAAPARRAAAALDAMIASEWWRSMRQDTCCPLSKNSPRPRVRVGGNRG
jgi:hypothetical protein